MEYGLWPPRPSQGQGWMVVLILVLMEYGLWRVLQLRVRTRGWVLILVLMEYGLWRGSMAGENAGFLVLILVLMEYGLWPSTGLARADAAERLNPCSNGIWSLTTFVAFRDPDGLSLNPCSNGIWSLTWSKGMDQRWINSVLILVLMEYGLWPSQRCFMLRSRGS